MGPARLTKADKNSPEAGEKFDQHRLVVGQHAVVQPVPGRVQGAGVVFGLADLQAPT